MPLDDPIASDPWHGADRSARFVVEAHGEPGILVCILAPFARRGIEFDWLACKTEHAILKVEACVGAMSDQSIRQVASNIRQVFGVFRLDVVCDCETETSAPGAARVHRLCA